MKSSGCNPDVVAYTALLDAFNAAGKINFLTAEILGWYLEMYT